MVTAASVDIVMTRLSECAAAAGLGRLDEDRERVQRVTEAMFQMRKVDIAGLRKAYAA